MLKTCYSVARLMTLVVVTAIIAFGSVLIDADTSSPQIESSARFKSPSARLVLVGAEVREKTIKFGDELVVLVTLQNQGKQTIQIPENSLLLKNEGWTSWSGGGSGLGESALVFPGLSDIQGIALQPGESVTLRGNNTEVAVRSLGPMTAEFVISTENEALRKDLGKAEPFSVSYYVEPSKLMISAWSAKTSEERRRLQPQFREVLLLASNEESWRDRLYVEQTLSYTGCYALPLLEACMKDPDPVVRSQAVLASARSAGASSNLNFVTKHLKEKKEGRDWAGSVGKCDEIVAVKDSIRLAIAGLTDSNSGVRITSISVLTNRALVESSLRRSKASFQPSVGSIDEQTRHVYESIGLVDPALPLVKAMAADRDPGVRGEAQKFLSNFASQPSVASGVASSLEDSDAGVRAQALEALRSSHDAPPIETIEKAFLSAKGDVALGLIELLYESEDSELAARLSPGFKDRSVPERLKILASIAGHADASAANLISLGLKDVDPYVQRVALARLLSFPTDQALAQIKQNAGSLSPDAQATKAAVQKELESRMLFPFLARGQSSAREDVFPSIQGTGPRVSPDGKWVAYVETGWGRPGGTGGLGRSNLLSIVHLVRNDGGSDHVVSDMFLVGWMADSRAVASARDGFANIVNLSGKVITEFGEVLDKPYRGDGIGGERWPSELMREQFGVRMPHSKILQRMGDDPRAVIDFDFGEDAAFSPDGKWFGPRKVRDEWQFIDVDGNKFQMKAPDRESLWPGTRAFWSPDGARIIVVPVHTSNSSGASRVINSRKAFVIDFATRSIEAEFEIDQIAAIGGWDYRKGRWNPWSADGKHLTFIRQGQVWIAEANGANAKRITFDGANKVFPTFSADGTRIAYITFQFDDREHYTRLGPTDVWTVDIASGLAVRLTQPDPARIEGVDWLDGMTLLFDRLEAGNRRSTLRRISLR